MHAAGILGDDCSLVTSTAVMTHPFSFSCLLSCSYGDMRRERPVLDPLRFLISKAAAILKSSMGAAEQNSKGGETRFISCFVAQMLDSLSS